MAVEHAADALNPVTAFALVGALGVGAQWIAWRLRLPAIVLMLAAGLVVGPVLGVFDPARDIGAITGPLISLAVAVILFEGGLTLDFHKLGDAAHGVRRLVLVGAPLGWLLSTLTLHYAAGLGWESSTVFGGIMVVTGPTVIAPLLRTARLGRRPASLLQWEAIVNDPIGAMAAVLAFQVVLVLRTAETAGGAFAEMALGILAATVIGYAAGWVLVKGFKRGLVPEYMKVPVLFVVLLACFALSDALLHESGLLAVTIMGLVIANSNLASFEELRRFKEHATILLVSGVFILLAASLDFATLAQLNWRAGLFVVLVVAVARPLTVLISLAFTNLPWRERTLIALTGPRGVVLVAVAGLFGERLAAAGVADGATIGPLAFVLVLATVVLHGFTLAPLARWLGLASADRPGVILVGGSRFTTGLAEALKGAELPVLVTDPNHARLLRPRAAGVPTFYGDILGETAENSLEFIQYNTIIAATENDAYNTLVATDLGPEFGRDNVWQITRVKNDNKRHALPTQLGGRAFGRGKTFSDLDDLMRAGWRFRITRLSAEYDLEAWHADRPEAVLLAQITKAGTLKRITDAELEKLPAEARLVWLGPPPPAESAEKAARAAKTGEMAPPDAPNDVAQDSGG